MVALDNFGDDPHGYHLFYHSYNAADDDDYYD